MAQLYVCDMRKLIAQEWISLDGYTSDKNNQLDFFAGSVRETYQDDHSRQFLATIDCILFGRKTYEQFAAVWPNRSIEGDLLAQKMNTAQKIVFSNSIDKAPWGKWKEATLESGNPITCISELKSSEGKSIVVWGSISLVQALMRESLVDEYHLFICPIVTGGGTKLFPEGLNQTPLTLIECARCDSGVVRLNYQVNRLKH